MYFGSSASFTFWFTLCSEALESSPSLLLAPRVVFALGLGRGDGDCGDPNSWSLHSEVSLLGRVSSLKNSIFICV